jgi:hypothetical protein
MAKNMVAGVRSVRLVSALAGMVGVAGSAALVWHASYSAFSASTANPTNTWSAGSVTLSDDDAGVAMFAASALTPGAGGTKCIAVTSTGTLPAAVKLYGTGYATTNALAANIDLAITQGTGGGSGSCIGFTPLASGASVYTGTLAGFATSATNYATGQGSWTPTGTGADTRVYQIHYTLNTNTPNTAENGTATLGFTWEAQNS